MTETTANQRYYITTAIDYPNAAPHIGHALEKVAADVMARYQRLLGKDTYFSMGIDENSQHVVKAADAHDTDPFTWLNLMDEAFYQAWRKLNISNDYWIRTTLDSHVRASQEMFRRAQQRGDIYTATYSGWYCPNCNTFYNDDELIAGRCPNHPSLLPEWVEEENYFFALSKYTERLLNYINEHPDFIVPSNRRAEVLSMLKHGLRDFSVSRRIRSGASAWGIPVPGDSEHVIYVWFDALTNYLTAVGFPDNMAKFEQYWPADVHVIGKDITRFHCLYWPAMLMSAGLPLPRQIAVHGFLSLEGERISKTAGNIIEPIALVDEFGVDAVRYYLVRGLSFASDGDFSRAGLIKHYNDELANDLGNLLNRVVSMINRYRVGNIPTPGPISTYEDELQRMAKETSQRSGTLLERWEPGNALSSIWAFVKRANQYIEQREPWKLAKDPEQSAVLDTVLYSAAEATRILAILLAPYIPTTSERILAQLGQEPIKPGALKTGVTWGSIPLTNVVSGPLLFPRVEAAGVE